MGHAAHYAVQNEERLRGLGGGLSTLASDLTLPTIGAYAGGPLGFFVGHTVQQVGKLAMRDVGAGGGGGQAATSGAASVAAARGRAAAGAASVVRQNFHGSGQRLDMPPRAGASSCSTWPQHLPKPPPAPRRHGGSPPPQPPPPWPAASWPAHRLQTSKARGRSLSAFQAREEQRGLEDAAHAYLARDPRIGTMIAGPNALR